MTRVSRSDGATRTSCSASWSSSQAGCGFSTSILLDDEAVAINDRGQLDFECSGRVSGRERGRCAATCVRMSLRKRFLQDVSHAGLPVGPGQEDTVTDSDLIGLPEPAQRYLRFMRVVERQRDWSFRLGFTGRFRMKPHQGWTACETWQYNSRLAIARIFHIRIRFGGVISVVARDTYLHGHGRLLIRLLDALTIQDGVGPEYDTGELVTYLNDGVLMAPSMLLVPAVTWSSVDSASLQVALADHGRTVTARMVVDERGAPTNFITTTSFAPTPPIRSV